MERRSNLDKHLDCLASVLVARPVRSTPLLTGLAKTTCEALHSTSLTKNLYQVSLVPD